MADRIADPGARVAVKDGRIVGVRGRAADRVNRGRLDPKDLNGWQANNSKDRSTHPLVRRNGRPGTNLALLNGLQYLLLDNGWYDKKHARPTRNGCCPRCCKASASPTRRPRRPVRSTTFTYCVA